MCRLTLLTEVAQIQYAEANNTASDHSAVCPNINITTITQNKSIFRYKTYHSHTMQNDLLKRAMKIMHLFVSTFVNMVLLTCM